jgi:uncharacterized SAM-binding protein YcdF (DUF218 family)
LLTGWARFPFLAVAAFVVGRTLSRGAAGLAHWMKGQPDRGLRVLVTPVVFALAGVGCLTVLATSWFALGLPLLFDRLVIQTSDPIPARAIVCVTAGLAEERRPSDEGWTRIRTAVQLRREGFAAWIIIIADSSGRAQDGRVYADAARQLGVSEPRIVLADGAVVGPDLFASLTHVSAVPLDGDSPLIIVTSPLKSRRAAWTFSKAGFRNFVVVTRFEGERPGAAVSRAPSGDAAVASNALDTTAKRAAYALTAVREVALLAWYRFAGWA